MSTISRGTAAEAAALHAFCVSGLPVFLPFGGGLPFDLVVGLPSGTLVRVQVKSGRLRKGCVEFNSSSTDHGRGQLSYRGRADIFAIHVAALSELYIVPVEACANYRGYLRLDPPRNNQRRRVRLAEDYTFEAWVRSLDVELAA